MKTNKKKQHLKNKTEPIVFVNQTPVYSIFAICFGIERWRRRYTHKKGINTHSFSFDVLIKSIMYLYRLVLGYWIWYI